MRKIIITENEAGQRTDRFLKKLLKDYTLGDIYKIFRTKKIKINGKREKENYMLVNGDEVELFIPDTAEKQEKTKVNLNNPLNTDTIVYEDENILVINKSPGILSQPDGSKEPSLVDMANSYLEKNEKLESVTFRPAICNRLDRNTGGLVIVAKNYQSLKAMNEAIRERKVDKFYQTIVKGKTPESGRLEESLVKNNQDNKVMVTKEGEGKESLTLYKKLVDNGNYSLLELELITGRTHQIRVHLSHANYPIIGDGKYGNKKTNEYFKSQYKLNHQMLYAYKLCFGEIEGQLAYLSNQIITCHMPSKYEKIIKDLFERG